MKEQRKDLRYEVLKILLQISLAATALAAVSNVVNGRPMNVVLQPVMASIFVLVILYMQTKNHRTKYVAKVVFIVFFNMIYLPVAWYYSPGVSSAIGYYGIMIAVVSVFFVEHLWEMSIPAFGIGVAVYMMRLELGNPNHFAPFADKTTQMNDVTLNYLVVILLLICIIAYINRHYVSEKERFYTLSVTDELTGVYNRRYILRAMEGLTREYHGSASYACLFIDINRFKEINDTYGHLAGDDVLVELGRMLKENFDICGRFGGDEFVVIMPEGETEATKRSVEILQEKFNEYATRNNYEHLSLSIGTTYSNGRKAEAIIKEADAYMYDNKRNSR